KRCRSKGPMRLWCCWPTQTAVAEKAGAGPTRSGPPPHNEATRDTGDAHTRPDSEGYPALRDVAETVQRRGRCRSRMRDTIAVRRDPGARRLPSTRRGTSLRRRCGEHDRPGGIDVFVPFARDLLARLQGLHFERTAP